MPSLKCKKVEYLEVDYGDLDNFISKHYGREFEVVADQEMGNDSSKSLTVKQEPLDEWERRNLDEWISTGRGGWLLRTIMTDLCNQGLIAPGEYLIEISW